MENYGLRQLQELRPSCDGQQQQQRPDVGSVLVVRFFFACAEPFWAFASLALGKVRCPAGGTAV